MARRHGKKKRMHKFIAAEERENPRRDFDRDEGFAFGRRRGGEGEERGLMRGRGRGGMRGGGRR